MKKLLLFTCTLFIVSISNAQYDRAIGLIYGKDGFGLSYKQFVQPEQNIQINLMYAHTNYSMGGLLVGLYEFHKEIHSSILHTTQLSWSYGGGLHAGYWATNGNYVPAAFKIGVDAVVGAEYNFDFIPVTIGLQFRPYVQYNTGEVGATFRYYNADGALILRYIID